MRILGIETSCDDTGIAIIDVKKQDLKKYFKILSNKIHTQVEIHKEFGGVFPMMAKREHGKNLVHTLIESLKDAKMYKKSEDKYSNKKKNKIKKILEREEELLENFEKIVFCIEKPDIDKISVTIGPGLEPALWVGISFAKALKELWGIEIIPVNHMEGHILSVLVNKTKSFILDKNTISFPTISLLVSGGHTELVLVKNFGNYKIIGNTRDDAAGEAFDKVARMLDLPYPGGPEISKLAEKKREQNNSIKNITFPRPMMYTKDYDFSFSGLKTSVLYKVKDIVQDQGSLDKNIKMEIAKEFEDSVVDVLVYKTIKAVKKYKAKNLIIGGGVSANNMLQKALKLKIKREKIKTKLYIPTRELSTDNALMIAIAGYIQKGKKNKSLKAIGNMSL